MIDVFARRPKSGETIAGYRFEFRSYQAALRKYRELVFDEGLRDEGARVMLIDDWDMRRSRDCLLASAEERRREERYLGAGAPSAAA